ncbi:MAG: glycoside hydrolase family 88 protein [Bacteroidetes bacterium]|nr:glycoside hydrolase family 88 protein [Bacteroidota bacterium]
MTKQERIELLCTVRDSWVSRHRPESESTDWGQSLAMYGLLRTLDITDDAPTREFLRRWLYFHLNEHVHINYFCGSWSFGLLYPTVATHFPGVRLQLDRTAQEMFDFIAAKALRNGEGIILHNVDLPNIYIDTVYYSSVLQAKLGTYLKREWKRDAMVQVRKHLNVLRDGERPLFIHAQVNLSGDRSQGAWARGNGWVMMTCAELLTVLKPSSVEYREILNDIFVPMCRMLKRLQSSSGLWRTILDDASAYEEASATAMYLFALARVNRLRVLPKEFKGMLTRAEEGLVACVDRNGRFVHVSEGTWPGTVEYYKSLDRGEWWWGTGAYLLALSELVADKLP